MSGIDPRRVAPRIPLDGLCGVVTGRDLRHASMLDLSAIGLRIERPFDPAHATRMVQLEIELPDVDELVWVRGEVTFAHLSPMGGRTRDGQPRFLCRAGIRIDRIGWNDRRLLRDYVVETRRARRTQVDLAS
ncbi:MAG TPA: PilZ domain-containing protein [Kofleriaceae bacterium]|nr:PilZ domain-containing protein [Kofleriaceae bacterium]